MTAEFKIKVSVELDYEKLFYFVVKKADIDIEWIKDEIEFNPQEFVKTTIHY